MSTFIFSRRHYNADSKNFSLSLLFSASNNNYCDFFEYASQASWKKGFIKISNKPSWRLGNERARQWRLHKIDIKLFSHASHKYWDFRVWSTLPLLVECVCFPLSLPLLLWAEFWILWKLYRTVWEKWKLCVHVMRSENMKKNIHSIDVVEKKYTQKIMCKIIRVIE